MSMRKRWLFWSAMVSCCLRRRWRRRAACRRAWSFGNGSSPATLTGRYPRLVACAVTGYGLDGPWAERKAYDLPVQCETGLVSLTGTPDLVAKAGISVADIAAGMYAYTGVLTALYRRLTTGAGGALDVSLFESLAEWMGQPAYYTQYGGTAPPRAGAQFAALDTATVVQRLDAANVANALRNSVEEFLDHPVLRERHRWQPVETPNGPVRALRLPVTFAGPPPPLDPVPALGQHTDQILSALGRSGADIAALRAAGVI